METRLASPTAIAETLLDYGELCFGEVAPGSIPLRPTFPWHGTARGHHGFLATD